MKMKRNKAGWEDLVGAFLLGATVSLIAERIIRHYRKKTEVMSTLPPEARTLKDIKKKSAGKSHSHKWL